MNIKSCLTDNAEQLLKRGLLVFIVAMFFCNIAIYLSLAVSARLQPQYWLGLLIVFVIILALTSKHTRFEVFTTPLFIWCLLFISLTLIMFVAIPSSHFQQVKERIRDVVLLTTLTGAFLMLRDQLRFLRKIILLAVILSVLINLVGIVHNRFLLPESIIYASRPAGFYINPNESGTALVLGMILSVYILNKRWRIPFVSVVFIGVLSTFSREAILAWIIIVGFLCIFGTIAWKKLLLWIVVTLSLAILVVFIFIELKIIDVYVARFYQDQIHRLIWFVHGIEHGASPSARITLLKTGWELFLRHPWVGNGIGSTEHWDMRFSTHNMYLYYMDDYGIIGAFLYPLLVWGICFGSRGEIRKTAWCMAAFLLFWGLLDHDIVRNYYSLFSISLMAALSRISATEQRNNQLNIITGTPESGNANPAHY